MGTRRKHAGTCADLFKQCGVDAWPRGGDFLRTGDASAAVDRAIGRPVVHLSGAVPSANSLRLPRSRDASLGSTHRFLYLQLRLEPGKTYAIHADYLTADRMQHRLAISNLHAGQEASRARRAGGLQVFLPAAHDAWTLLAIDLQAAAAAAAGGGGGGGGGSPYARLKALTLCANMTVRGAFTSDVVYEWSTLPADLAFSAAFNVGQAQDLWVPGEPPAGPTVAAPRLRPSSPRPALPPGRPASPRPKQLPASSEAEPADDGQQEQVLLPEPIAQLEHVAALSGGRPGLLHWAPAADGGCPEVVYAAGSLIVAMRVPAGGQQQIQQAQQGQQQRYLRGHTGRVQALALSADGARLASAQEGPASELRLWDLRTGECLATVPGHAGGTTCLDLAPDGSLLATAGVDSQGRQELAVWDVSACWAAGSSGSGSKGGSKGGMGARPREVARQASEYNVQAVKFVPFDLQRVVTCGKNSIRVHRLKDGQLRSLSVPMDGVAAPRRPYSCGTLASSASGSASVGEVFTCLAFEPPLRERPLSARRAYVGTASGAAFVVDIEGRSVEAVSQVHSGEVAALAVHEGFCATGSADSRLRLWGCDLREAYMEAGHEGAVTGLALSPDGLWLAAGTASGALSLLDISASKYATLLRSHTASVHALAVLGTGQPGQADGQQQYATAGADGTVRVWSAADRQQVLELCAPGQTVLSIACHPDKPEVACGFQGGALRIFDAASAALLQESQQHTGSVVQLAYARHGRVLLSLGEDGCVCAYIAERSYMPTTFVLAGFPLHATAMAASSDGKLLAVAALSLHPASTDPQAGSKGSAGSSCKAQPVCVLFDTLTMQPALQFSLAGHSRVSQLLLLPGGRHVLALTEGGRLLGYRCADGSLALDVPRCLPGPCLAASLDPSGSFLVASSGGGHLKAWGLQQLGRLAEQERGDSVRSRGVIRSLPCQELSAVPGSAVRALAFLSQGQLLTAGDGGEVCSWRFLGEPSSSMLASKPPALPAASQAVAAAVDVSEQAAQAAAVSPAAAQPLQTVQPAAATSKAHKPASRLSTERGQQQPAAAPCDSPPAAIEVRPKLAEVQTRSQQQPEQSKRSCDPASGGSPSPRPLPAALQRHQRARPPSAPARGTRQEQAAPAAAEERRASASLPGTPSRKGGARELPIWERYLRKPEASLLITATPGKRCTQVVRQERQLRVTSPTKRGGGGGGKGQQRSAEWVEAEVAADRVPAYRPEQQLQLLPPSASVRRVCGFGAAAGFHWLPAEGQPQRLLYAAGNVLVLEELQSGEQAHVARLPRNVTALAASADGRLAAVAVQPAASQGSTAEVHLMGLQAAGANQPVVLSHHSFPVQHLSFSPDGALLASLSSPPSGSAAVPACLALWSPEEPAELVAAVDLPAPVFGLAWEPSPASGLPTFYLAGSQGLQQWQLEPSELSSTKVHLPAALRGAALTAVAVPARAADGEAAEAAVVFVGDGSGRVWQLEVDSGQDVRRSCLLAELSGETVTCLEAAGQQLLAVGTSGGTALVLEAQEEREGEEAGWGILRGEQLDGAVISVRLDSASKQLIAATACGTLWQVAFSPGSAQPEVMLCGQQGGLNGWHLAPGAAWKGVPPTAALASAAGVALWQLGERSGSGRAPLVEFSLPPNPTHVSLAEDASVCAASYPDGSVCLYDVKAARLRWQSAGAAAGGDAVAALAVVQRLRGCKVLLVFRSGALLMLDGASRQVVHRSRQFAVVQDSGRLCPANFPAAGLAVHPTDSSLIALCGQSDLLVCRAAFSKNAALTPLARLSFDPLLGTQPGGQAAGLAGPPPEPHRAVQAAFSRAHPGHLYCSNPCSPGHILLFDYGSREVVKTLLAPLGGSGAGLTALALHPSEDLLAAGTSSGSVLLLRLETESWAELAAHAEGAPVTGLAFSPCGGRLFSAAAGACATLVWEVGP